MAVPTGTSMASTSSCFSVVILGPDKQRHPARPQLHALLELRPCLRRLVEPHQTRVRGTRGWEGRGEGGTGASHLPSAVSVSSQHGGHLELMEGPLLPRASLYPASTGPAWLSGSHQHRVHNGVWSCLGSGVGGECQAIWEAAASLSAPPACPLHWGTRFQATKSVFFRARQMQGRPWPRHRPHRHSRVLICERGSSPCPPLPEGLIWPAHMEAGAGKDAKGQARLPGCNPGSSSLNFS